MLRIWLIGIAIYILGVGVIMYKVDKYAEENIQFSNWLDNLKEAKARTEDSSLSPGVPVFIGIIPIINLFVGTWLIYVAINKELWKKLVDQIIDKI